MNQQKKTYNEVQIRWYVPTDYALVKNLIQDLAKIYRDDFNDYLFENLMQMRLLSPSSGTFVAIKDQHTCGCAFADSERDPRGVLHGRISNINVLKEFQNQGIGGALLDEAVKFLSALRIPNIWANVNPNNPSMMKMFEGRGFRKFLKVMERPSPRKIPITTKIQTQPEITLRTITHSDLNTVKILILKLSALFQESFEPYWFDLSIRKYFEDPNARIFVAVQNEIIMGMAFAELQRDPMGNMRGYISNILVDEMYRGKGIGTLLLNETLIFLANLEVSAIWANINHNNASMQKIFENAGFSHKFTVFLKRITR